MSRASTRAARAGPAGRLSAGDLAQAPAEKGGQRGVRKTEAAED